MVVGSSPSCSYKSLVFEPIHLDGRLLDHVYISNSFCANKATAVVIKNIYFSDHDAVKLQMTLKSNSDIEESIDFSILWSILTSVKYFNYFVLLI